MGETFKQFLFQKTTRGKQFQIPIRETKKYIFIFDFSEPYIRDYKIYLLIRCRKS